MQTAYNNWQSVCTFTLAGTQAGWYGAPGYMETKCTDSSKPGSDTMAQNYSYMKNPRKQQGNNAVAQQRTGISYPSTQQDRLHEILPLEEPEFSEKPAPRMLLPLEEESFRTFIKANLPHHKASPALISRIKNSIRNPE